MMKTPLTATGHLAKCAFSCNCTCLYVLFAVMHLGAVAAMLFRYHNNKTIKDVLTRLDTDKLVGTLVFSDPATGMEGSGILVLSRHGWRRRCFKLLLNTNITDLYFHAIIDLADFCNENCGHTTGRIRHSLKCTRKIFLAYYRPQAKFKAWVRNVKWKCGWTVISLLYLF